MSIINPSIGIVLTSSTALLISIAILKTNEYISKLKIRYTKLRDWINVNTLLYEKTLKESMIDKKKDEKEVNQLQQIYNHYFDKRSDILKNTQFKVEDVFGDVISKDSAGILNLVSITILEKIDKVSIECQHTLKL